MGNEIIDLYGKFGDAVIHRVIMEGMTTGKATIKLQMTALNMKADDHLDSISLEFEDAYFIRLTSLHTLTFIIFSAYVEITNDGVIFDFDPAFSENENKENPDSEFIIKAKRVSIVKIPDLI